MKKRKEPWECKTVSIKCAVCVKCSVYIEGPLAGSCLYNGPFSGYNIENFEKDRINEQDMVSK